MCEQANFLTVRSSHPRCGCVFVGGMLSWRFALRAQHHAIMLAHALRVLFEIETYSVGYSKLVYITHKDDGFGRMLVDIEAEGAVESEGDFFCRAGRD